ncbi:Uncharacterised protein [Myroides odoratus]|nr:hypothetical protein Myrod_0695 [Myroides odoratus DSM 2801]EKB02676.1 hypothetical protein HMPREF9716_03705 [Myroides odoratus CIP 103059]STZ28794.1 Uncharacterised protein [Myroides odoratus]
MDITYGISYIVFVKKNIYFVFFFDPLNKSK